MRVDETKLKSALRAGNIDRLYFLYGKEIFLVKTYADRLIEALKIERDDGFNFIKFEGNPNLTGLYEAVDTLPVFSEKKVILLNDLDPEKYDDDSQKRFLEIIENIPDSAVLIIYQTGIELDIKKSKTKKIISGAENSGTVCEFAYLTPAKSAELAIKKAGKAGIVLNRNAAVYLCEKTLRNLTLIGIEIEKLCVYVGKGGEVTREVVDLLVPRQLDAGIFALADAVTSKKNEEAFGILKDLIDEGYQPVVIMSALSGTFVDFYRVKLAHENNIPRDQIVSDFSYPKNRSWIIGKISQTVNKFNLAFIKKSIKILFETDYKLKSSPLDNEILMERAIAEIL